MPRYRNKENGLEMDASKDFAAIALPESLYEVVADETTDERVQRELQEARDAKVEPADSEFDSVEPTATQPVSTPPADEGDIVTPPAGQTQNGDVR
jgi:hypothetical protein